MYLKSLEIRGFKSFADKTELEFKNGIIGIVGPNGSGKSNVSDAVRWVLGEQSVKSLRGGKMEDIIFAGTQFRKPVGLAQVVLTLDNSDNGLPVEYSDVTIGRRLYRSGDSEYYINNSPCRLKDVQELFMDTGIGKEGYSIIGQGKIDAILSGKPEDRRSLMEEAAGIVKFKHRKEEAEKKLSNTDENILRINDILSTYEDRIEPLKSEKEKAEVFIRLSNEYKEKQINCIVHSVDIINEKCNKVKEELQELNRKKEEFYNIEKILKENEETLNKEEEEIESRNIEDKRLYYASKEEFSSILSNIKLLEERIQNLINSSIKLEAEISENNVNYKSASEEKERLLKLKETLFKSKEATDTDLKDLNKQREELNEKINNEEYVLKNLKDDQFEYLNQLSTIKNTMENLTLGEVSLKERYNNIKNSCKSYENSLKINETTENGLTGEIKTIEDYINDISKSIKTKKDEETKINSLINKKDKELKELSAEENKLLAGIQMLKNLEKSYEGYNRSIKSIMKDILSGRLSFAKDKCFILGEVIDVKKEYGTAIEIALGGALSDVITEDEGTAKKLINHLKINNLGRATFLPLSIIKGKKIENTMSLKNLEGYIGVASELIKFDSKFTPAIDYVLGRTLLARDMDSALNIARASKYSFKIVTLSGEVINPGGSMTGGSIYGKGSNILGRKHEIEEMELKVENLKKDISEVNNEILSNRSIYKKLDDEILNLVDEKHFKNIEITKIQGKILAVKKDTDNLIKNLQVAKNEMELIKISLNKNLEEMEHHKKDLDFAKEREKENVDFIKAKEEALVNMKDELLCMDEKIMEIKISIAKAEENAKNNITQLDRVNEELLSCEEKKVKAYETKESYEIEKENSKKQILEDQKKSEELKIVIEDLDKKFEKDEAKRAELKEKIKKVQSDIEENSEMEKDILEKVHRQELISAKQDSDIEFFYNKLKEEFSITYAEALNFKAPIENFDKYKEAVKKLKDEIRELGVVNVGAIAEYEETFEKYNLYKTQIEDLNKAKEELFIIIKDMTQKMKSIFSENFSKLREYFSETFRELFKGGSADLILGEGDELSCNIEINVEPPGKKLQNINLMSGGEKVLSAIALLFAILKMKPTPFCILDEIEAALDDANVNRYAEFLRKFSGDVQFIVITHRKGTMQVSDVLYGVTMEEKGVSKVVSVDLEGAS